MSILSRNFMVRRSPCGSRAWPLSIFLAWVFFVCLLYIAIPALETSAFIAISIAISVVLFVHAVPEFIVFQYSRPTYLNAIANDPLAINVFVVLTSLALFGLGCGTFLVYVGEKASGNIHSVWSSAFVNTLASWLVLFWTWQFYAVGAALWIANQLKKRRPSTWNSSRQLNILRMNPLARAVQRRQDNVSSINNQSSTTCTQKFVPLQVSASPLRSSSSLSSLAVLDTRQDRLPPLPPLSLNK